MRLRSLGDLRSDVRKRADVVNATKLLADADVNEWINQGWARVYGHLCRTGEDYYLAAPFLWSTTSGIDTYFTTNYFGGGGAGSCVLPPDIYRLKGLDAQTSAAAGSWLGLQRQEFEARNDNQAQDWSWPAQPAYTMVGAGAATRIILYPPPSSGVPMRLWYYPAAVRMLQDTDTIDGGNGWELAVIDWAARMCAERDENYELAARLDQSFMSHMQQVVDEAANRNAGQAKKIRRVRYKDNNAFRPGRW